MSEINWVHKDSTTIKEVADKETQQRVIENSKDYIIERLQQENNQLKEQLEYLRSNEYLNQVKWERNFNEELVKDLQQALLDIKTLIQHYGNEEKIIDIVNKALGDKENE